MTYTNLCGNILTAEEKKVDFHINKMSRSTYDELCASGYMDEHPYDLYLVDDVNFDLQGKRIINVGAPDPTSKQSTPNLEYLESNFISKTNINEYSDNSFYIQNSKIISLDRSACLSADGNFYSKLSGDSDWKITAISCPYDVSQLTVYYRENTAPLGWTIKTPDNLTAYSFNVEDKNVQYLFKRFESDDGTLCGIISISRDNWSTEPIEKTVKSSELSNYILKSTVKNCISSIETADDIDAITNILSNLYNAVK